MPSAKGRSSARTFVMIAALVGVVLLVVALGVGIYWSISADPALLRRQAAEAQSEGNPVEVKRFLDQLEEVEPLTSSMLLGRSQAETKLGLPEEALRDLERIPDTDPIAGVARMSQGQIALRRKRLPAAERLFLKALELDPTLIQAHRELIYIYGMQLRRKELDREFRAYSKLRTLDFAQCYLWCLGRTVEWDANEQVSTLREFLEADPSDRWSRLALAYNLLRINKTEEAMDVLEPLPADDPEAIALRVQIALGRHDQETARSLLESAPEDDPALNQIRGQLALSRRDVKSALRYFEAANRAEPNDRTTLTGMASALRLLGQTERAAEVQEQSRRLDAFSTLLAKGSPKNTNPDPDFPLKIGRACLDAGLIPQAEAWFRFAVATNPLDSRAKEALYDLLHEDEG